MTHLLHNTQAANRAESRRPGKQRRRGASASTTLLAVVAVVVVCSAGYRFLASGATGDRSRPPDESPPGPAASYFEEVSETLQVRFTHLAGNNGEFYIPEEMGAGGALLDYDGDGDLDLYLVQGGKVGGKNLDATNRLFRNDLSEGRFVDVSEQAGADIPGYGMGAYVADIDNDGDSDLFITRLGSNVLLRNEGDGTFADISVDAGINHDGFSTGAAFFDFDRDGLLDLYVANYIDWSSAIELPCHGPSGVRDYCNPIDYKSPAEDRLYRNLGDGKFSDVTVESGIAGALGHGLGVLANDFDGNGWIDLYISNDQNPAFYWVNLGNGKFEDRAALSGCAFNADGIAIAGMGVISEDLDGDKDLDLVVTNIHDQPHLALRNDVGAFEDVSRRWGFAGWGVPHTGFGVTLFDRDDDGSLDGIVANGAVNLQIESERPGHPYAEPNQYFSRGTTGRFVEQSAEAGFPFGEIEMSRSTLTGDWDNDGDVDVVVTNNRGPVKILENRYRNPGSAGANSWASIEIASDSGNNTAMNAIIYVTAGDIQRTRMVHPHTGYLSSNDPRVHFGLGQARKIDEIRITYPGNTEDVFRDVPVNRFIRITQGRQDYDVAGDD